MSNRRLIVFGRFPEPGSVKTRLIPTLGPVGAADLQRQMTEQIVDVAMQVDAASVEFCIAGGTRSGARRWLDRHPLTFTRQSSGDLGNRMQSAIAEAHAGGDRPVVLVGTDTPDVTAGHIESAFDALNDHDMVLGPSTDGGYWLIGMNRPADVFKEIEWGTAKVLSQTMAAGDRLGLCIHQLPLQNDIDDEADLAAWQPRQDWSRPYMSVIIPALNEDGAIESAINSALSADSEVIVVDGGSKDRTVACARAVGARVISSPQGRALQQNLGAREAKGQVLLFLHADSRLPKDYSTYVFETLMMPDNVAGAFRFKTDYSNPSMRLIERTVQIRSRLFQMPYGDQGLYLPKALFERLGGFPIVPIAEDLYLVRRMARMGRIGLAPAEVLTSGRRWRNIGVWRATLINYLIAGGCLLQVPPRYLAPLYALWTKPRTGIAPMIRRGPN